MPLIINHVNLIIDFLCTELKLESRHSLYLGLYNTVLNNLILL